MIVSKHPCRAGKVQAYNSTAHKYGIKVLEIFRRTQSHFCAGGYLGLSLQNVNLLYMVILWYTTHLSFSGLYFLACHV